MNHYDLHRYISDKKKEYEESGFVPTLDLLLEDLEHDIEHDCHLIPLTGEGHCEHPSHEEKNSL